MRASFALLFIALTPSLVLAQATSEPEIVRAATGISESPFQLEQILRERSVTVGIEPGMQSVMPLWSTPDGRILAIVAMGSADHALPTLAPAPQVSSAADWKLIDITDFVAGGVSLRLSDGVNAFANLDEGIVLAPIYATDCGADVELVDSRCAAPNALGTSGALHLGTAVSAGNVDLDLSYGLSWLRLSDPAHANATPQPILNLFAGLDTLGMPSLIVPRIELTNSQSSGFSAAGHWHFDEGRTLDLGAALSRIQYVLPGNANSPLPNLNQAAISFGLHHGDFSGVVVGRVLGPGDPLNGSQRWSSLDLGISWRSPWRGVFSVGAQNLWSSGNPPALLDPAAHDSDPSQARVPYVQYHQDL
jgi:hypothetical protein